MIRHLVRGLIILGERWTANPKKWAGAGENWLDTGVRWLILAVVGFGAFRLVSLSWPVLGVAVLVVAVLALRAATKAANGVPEKAKSAPAAEPQEAAVDGLPEVSPQEFLELLYDTLGTARGVHLRTLAAALIHRVGGAWEVADVRRLCEASGVAVTPTVRAPGGKPTVGVYRADVPPLPAPSPEAPPVPVVGVVVAGQPGTTSPTTPASTTPTTPTRTRVGDQLIVSTDDPDNPARTHVQVIDITRKKTRPRQGGA